MSAAERRDDYLLLPGCETASVKIREGRLEVKVSTGSPESVVYTETVAGNRDTWLKWSRRVEDTKAILESATDDAQEWLGVSKQRDLRLVSLDGSAPQEIEPNTVLLENGCQFELTRIRVDHDDQQTAWWSFSFEAFGKPDRIVENLEIAAAFVLQEEPPLVLDTAQSGSYPEWLQRWAQHS